MSTTLKELYEYNKNCVIEEILNVCSIQKKEGIEYILEEIPTKEDFLIDFESSLLSPWANIIDYDEEAAKSLTKEYSDEISNLYDEIQKLRDDFKRR